MSANSSITSVSSRALEEQQRDRGDLADEAGAAPGGEERDATLLARRLEPLGHLGREGAPARGQLRTGAHDVLARRQEPAQLVEVEAARHVQDAVGLERDERVDVVGGRDTGVRTGPRELAGVDADLVGAVHAHAHDLEVRVRERRAQRPSTDVPRRPLHDAVPHQNPPRSAWYRIRTVRTCPGGTRQRGDRGVPRRAGPLARRAPHRARTALRRRGHPGRADGAAVAGEAGAVRRRVDAVGLARVGRRARRLADAAHRARRGGDRARPRRCPGSSR